MMGASLSNLSFADDWQELSTKLDQHKGFSAEFSQTITAPDGSLFEQSKGNMAASKPNKLRWITTQPWPQELYVNNSSVWLYDPDLEQVTLKTVKSSANANPAMIFTGGVNAMKPLYDLSCRPDVCVLTEKSNAKTDYPMIQVSFDSSKVVGLRFKDQIGQLTDIKFTNVSTQLPATSLFEFKPPEGVDVDYEQ